MLRKSLDSPMRGERYGEIEYRMVKFYNDGVVQACSWNLHVTFA